MLLAPRIVHTIRAGALICASLIVAAAGFVVIGQADGNNLTPVVAGLIIVFAGLMPASALGLTVVVDSAPPQRAGAAAAISETAQEIGGALGIAVLGSIATAATSGPTLGDGIPAAAIACAALLTATGIAAAGLLREPSTN